MKIEWCVERGNSEKNSEFQMAFEPTTFHTLVGYSNHWATRTLVVSDGQLRADTTTASHKSHYYYYNYYYCYYYIKSITLKDGRATSSVAG